MTRNFVEKKLLEIGIPAGIQGFLYITDAIMLMDKEKEEFCSNGKMTWLYDMVAEKNFTSGSCVERSIRFAFGAIRKDETRRSIADHYIGLEKTQNKHSLFKLYMVLEDEFTEPVMSDLGQFPIREFICSLANQYGLKIAVLN